MAGLAIGLGIAVQNDIPHALVRHAEAIGIARRRREIVDDDHRVSAALALSNPGID